jgi:hypothetical protein
MSKLETEVSRNQIFMGPVLGLFSGTDGCGSVALDSEVKAATLIAANHRCQMCGEGEYRLWSARKNRWNCFPVSVAHLVPGNPARLADTGAGSEAIKMIQPPYYEDEYNFGSARNTIALCGTKTVHGSCHWAFDNHFCAILYQPFSQMYEVFWLDDRMKCYTRCDTDPPFVAPESWNPYQRGLAFHALESVRRHAFQGADKLLPIIQRARLSSAVQQSSVMSVQVHALALIGVVHLLRRVFVAFVRW